MKFFVPYTDCDGQAEAIWSGLRERLLDDGLSTTRRRIEALSLDDRRPDWRLEVGDGAPDTGEPVLVILESSDRDLYFVFTPGHGLIHGQPYSLALPEHGSAIPFEANAIERLWGNYLK
jgi:hypothetical protein